MNKHYRRLSLLALMSGLLYSANSDAQPALGDDACVSAILAYDQKLAKSPSNKKLLKKMIAQYEACEKRDQEIAAESPVAKKFDDGLTDLPQLMPAQETPEKSSASVVASKPSNVPSL